MASHEHGGRRRLRIQAVALALFAAAVPSGAAGDSSALPRRRATPLFDGKSLAGWEGKLELWTVENGELVGRMPNPDRCEFLRHKKELSDFRLIVEVKLANDEGDSGIMFRSDVTADGDMPGYMADIGQNRWGCLVQRANQHFFNALGKSASNRGEWNTYEILAVGNRIQLALNGHSCCDVENPNGPRSGRIGLQLNNWAPLEIRFRKFQLEIDPKPVLKTVK